MQTFWRKTVNHFTRTRQIAPLLQSLFNLIASPFTNKVSHRINIITAILLLLGILVVSKLMGFGESKPPILPGEIDLSGAWRISLEDRPEFAKKNFDDSTWCYTGVPDPKLGRASPSNATCSETYYPADKMRNRTFWYRTWLDIPSNSKWKNPSLFLGAIKTKAWIYWNEELIAISNIKDGTGMTTVQLEERQVTPGRHLLAIRVQSRDTRYPGIFHAYPRGVVLGEVEGNESQHNTIVQSKYTLPALTVFVQVTGLLLTLLLLALGKGIGTEFLWLAIYFFATSVAAMKPLTTVDHRDIILRLSIAAASFGVFGYSLKFHSWLGKQIHIVSRSLFLLLILTTVGYGYLLASGNFFGTTSTRITLAIAIVPFLAFIFSLGLELKAKIFNGSKWNFSWINFLTLFILGILHSLNVIFEFFLSGTPNLVEHPAFKLLLSIALVATMIYHFTQQERILSFYGRFIRPGLKNLLNEKIRKSNYSDEKLFRPRQIAIMKVDIVGHTEATFQMPYGIKRLFQDTWFTLIDQVVADRVFMDKNVGDGSIYCFSEHHPEGSCGSALSAALQIRDEALERFDIEFLSRLKQLLHVTEELKEPAEAYFRNYKARTGIDFWKRKTKTRIALVYGFVDEGLWGLSSQSHYDVQGDLVSLVTRIESKAKSNEILMDEKFLKQVENKLEKGKISPRLEALKGMGEVKLFAITPNVALKIAA